MYNHQATLGEAQRVDLAAYDRWLDDTIAGIDRLLPLCDELGIRVLIDLHSPPGGSADGQMAIFAEPRFQRHLIQVWTKLTTHFKDKPAVWGYDLVNEPMEGVVADGLLGWHALAEQLARTIRAIDPKRAIVVEPGPAGGWGDLDYFEPIDVPGVVYSVHLYEPLRLTHQGVLDGYPRGVTYPGTIDGKHWDRDALRAALQPVRDYQLDYNVPVYVGEFSAVRWAPGDSAARYLADAIDVFESFGWDWSYHAYREWHGWDVEIPGGREVKDNQHKGARVETPRMKVLLEGFAKNRVRR